MENAAPSTIDRTSFAGQFRRGLSGAMRADAIFLIPAGTFFLYAWITSSGTVRLVTPALGILFYLVLSGLAARAIYYVAILRPEHPIPHLLTELASAIKSPGSLARLLPPFIAILLTTSSFWWIKASLRDFEISGWDATLSELDRIIHFGTHPWQWLQPIVGYWPLTFLINWNYQFWLATMWATVAVFVFWPNARLTGIRTRFLLTFILSWILCGSVLAGFFLSAGPCYLVPLGLDGSAYAELIGYLRTINKDVVSLPALRTQELLWDGYVGKLTPLGISAMPSLHNGICLLMVLAARHYSRPLTVFLAIHGALVFVGSIHLSWHYAVDAYVSWGCVLALWFLCRPIATAWDRSIIKSQLSTYGSQQ